MKTNWIAIGILIFAATILILGIFYAIIDYNSFGRQLGREFEQMMSATPDPTQEMFYQTATAIKIENDRIIGSATVEAATLDAQETEILATHTAEASN